jgi:hypothetical protein
MQRSDILPISTTLSTRAVPDAIRRWLGGRRGLIVAGAVIVAAGLALGWSWLSAIGVAPIILSLAPCAAMCALGACAMMKGGSSCAKPGSLEQAKAVEATPAPPRSDGQMP